MPFERPTLAALKARIAADIERNSGESATARGDIYYPIAQAHAGACYGLHTHLDYNRDQLFDDTADDENLLRRAAEMGIYQIAATRASGTATIVATDGTVILAETIFTKDQIAYRVTESATAESGSATLNLRAVEPGINGNLTAGKTLTISATIAGADTTATVVEISGGAEAETVSRVRERLADRRQNPPMGGNANDYIKWAKEAHIDVTRAWSYPNENGLGTVVVRFVTDDLATPIPSPAHITAVQDYIDVVRPAGMAGFSVATIVAAPLDITFTSLTPDTSDVRLAVEAELDDLIKREAIPGGTLALSAINEAISGAAGETDHVIDLAANVTSTPNQLIVLGTITWPA